MLLLRVEPQRGEPFTHEAAGDSLVVGRSSKADLKVPDPFMSRLHARFFREGDRWLVEDLGGRNPTLLNGRRVSEPTRVVPGDLVTVAETQISLESPAAERATPGRDSTLYRSASALLAAQDSGAFTEDLGEAGLRRQTNRLRVMNDFHRALATPLALPELLELALDRAFADLRPEEGVIFLKAPDGRFTAAASRRLPGATATTLDSQSLIREVTEKNVAALILDASSDSRFATSESIMLSGLRSLVAAPLFDSEGCLGVIVLGSRAHVHRFSEEDMEELVSLASVAALRIRHLALAEEVAERRLVDKELSLARQIQVALLPDALPEIPGYELLATNEPTRAVSGDFYQVQMRRDSQECVLLLADVSGKGLAASLLTASLEALAAGPIEMGQPPEVVCEGVSRRLYARTSPERYATAFLGVLHTATGRLCYCSAGHNPALLLRASGEVETLGATGLPLGILPDGSYGREEKHLQPGDLLVVYTDGISEATNPGGEESGVERLVALCRRHATRGVTALAEALNSDLGTFAEGVPFGDDRTLVLLRRKP